MTNAPEIDWTLARRLGVWTGGETPEISRPDALAEVASLRLAAARAGELVTRQFGPGGLDHRVAVVDRDGWQRGIETMVEGMLDAMGLQRRAPGVVTTVQRGAIGAATGLVLGAMGRRLLGQYDPIGRRLLLAAPTIYATRSRLRIGASDFHLWVCLHEQTHAAQFAAAPWLSEHFVGQLSRVSRGKGLDEAVALMTFLEGHADLITHRAAARQVTAVAQLRRAFGRRQGPRRSGMLGAWDKGAQYRDGLAFCRAATSGRRAALNAAFEDPAKLPTLAEIADPRAWVARVHG